MPERNYIMDRVLASCQVGGLMFVPHQSCTTIGVPDVHMYD